MKKLATIGAIAATLPAAALAHPASEAGGLPTMFHMHLHPDGSGMLPLVLLVVVGVIAALTRWRSRGDR